MYLNRTLELRILDDVCFNLNTSEPIESLRRACASCQKNHRLYELDKTDQRYSGR
jgi:hypothetical protein